MTTNKPKNTDQDLLELAAKAAGMSRNRGKINEAN